MNTKRKRNLLLGIVAALAAAGAVVALVLSPGGGKHASSSLAAAGSRSLPAAPNEVALAARYLGMSRTQVRSEMRSGMNLAQIAEATHGRSAAGLVTALVRTRAAQLESGPTAGKLSASARNAQLANLRRRIKRQVDRTPRYVGLPAAARYLGITTAQLRSELESGHSLAQIAEARRGKSATGLIDARASAREAAIEKALASGKISKATANTLLSSLRARVTSEVQRRPGP